MFSPPFIYLPLSPPGSSQHEVSPAGRLAAHSRLWKRDRADCGRGRGAGAGTRLYIPKPVFQCCCCCWGFWGVLVTMLEVMSLSSFNCVLFIITVSSWNEAFRSVCLHTLTTFYHEVLQAFYFASQESSRPRAVHTLTSICCPSGWSSCCLPACCWASASSSPSWLASTPTLTLINWIRFIWRIQWWRKTTTRTWSQKLMTSTWRMRGRAPDCNRATWRTPSSSL